MISLKSVNPLLPPNAMPLRTQASIKAKVSAWVMIEKHTPVTRELHANQPKTCASDGGEHREKPCPSAICLRSPIPKAEHSYLSSAARPACENSPRGRI